jgi:hypothetical protein
MREVIRRLPNLPPISLEAEAVGDRFGDVPFTPVFRVHPSKGVVLKTRIILFQNGTQPEESADVGDSGDFNPITLRIPGIFFMQVRRTGITGTGFTVLTKNFHVEGVEAPPPPPPPPKEPTISATTEGAGANTVLVVTGSGFLPILPNRIVTVRVVDDALHSEKNFQQSSTPSGELKMRINLPCNSGLPFHVSATDSRPGPGILGVVFSNTVTLLCP